LNCRKKCDSSSIRHYRHTYTQGQSGILYGFWAVSRTRGWDSGVSCGMGAVSRTRLVNPRVGSSERESFPLPPCRYQEASGGFFRQASRLYRDSLTLRNAPADGNHFLQDFPKQRLGQKTASAGAASSRTAFESAKPNSRQDLVSNSGN